MATFGFTSIGGTLWTPGSEKWGCKFTLSENASVESITFYGRWDGTGSTNNKAFIYNDNAGSPNVLQGVTPTFLVDSTSVQWWTATFSSPIALTAGVYWLGILMQDAGTYAHYDAGAASQNFYDDVEDIASISDPCAAPTAFESKKISIYATYTATAIVKDMIGTGYIPFAR